MKFTQSPTVSTAANSHGPSRPHRITAPPTITSTHTSTVIFTSSTTVISTGNRNAAICGRPYASPMYNPARNNASRPVRRRRLNTSTGTNAPSCNTTSRPARFPAHNSNPPAVPAARYAHIDSVRSMVVLPLNPSCRPVPGSPTRGPPTFR